MRLCTLEIVFVALYTGLLNQRPQTDEQRGKLHLIAHHHTSNLLNEPRVFQALERGWLPSVYVPTL